MKQPYVYAHRGASGYAPENTLPAFEKALEMGADGIEIDVHFSKDGALVVINADTRLSVNANSRHPEAAKRFVEYFTRMENIQRFVDQQSSFSPLQGGAPSAAEEIQPLIDCYAAGRVVIGADGLLDLPIWDWTAEASKKLLGGQSLDEVMGWLEEQARGEGGTPS